MLLFKKNKEKDFLSKDELQNLLNNPYVNDDIKLKIEESMKSGHYLYSTKHYESLKIYNAKDYIDYLNNQNDQFSSRILSMLTAFFCLGVVLIMGNTVASIAFGVFSLGSFAFLFYNLFKVSKIHKQHIETIENDNKDFLKLFREANINM